MKRLLVLMLACIVLPACASVQSVNLKSFAERVERVDPGVGEEASITLGETLIRQSSIAIAPAIELTLPYRTQWVRNSGSRAFPFTFEAGAQLLKSGEFDGTPIYSGPSEGGLLRPDGTQIGAPYGIGVTSDGTVKYVVVGGGLIPESEGRTASFEEVQAVQETSKNLRQEFIYSGRDETALFFTYREFSGDLIRPAFTQNVTYSLGQGDVVAFKGLRVRVLSATNTEIRYEILSSF